MANLGLAFASSEADLLKSYFQRDHNYRTALFRPENKALVEDDGFGFANPDFAAALGTEPVKDYWYHQFTLPIPTSYLFASRTGKGGLSRFEETEQRMGSYNLGDAGLVGTVYGSDRTPVHAVFTMEGGSYMGDWNNRSLIGGVTPK